MKKLLSILLTLLLIISALTISCFANNPVKLTLNSETDTVYAGDEFVVKLMISDNSKMSGAALDVNYDSDKLEYVSGTFGGILDASATKSINNVKGDSAKVRFTYLAPSSSVTSQGVLVSIKFRALDNADGLAKLTITVPNPGDFIAQDLSRLSYTVEDANIKIINVSDETESETEQESESESQQVETIVPIETTTKPVEEIDEDDKDIEKTIIFALALGFVFLLIVVLLSKKPSKKNSKTKKKKRRK